MSRTVNLDVLDRISVAAPCTADWGSMAGDDRVRFCSECRLNVYNLSAMSREDAMALVAAKEGRLCVRFYRRADGTVLTQDCPVGLRLLRRKVAGGVARAGAAAALLLSTVVTLGRGAADPMDRAAAAGAAVCKALRVDLADAGPTDGRKDRDVVRHGLGRADTANTTSSPAHREPLMPRTVTLDVLDRISVASPCTADWGSMVGDDRVRFCSQCRLNVYNLSAMSREEGLRLIETTEGRLCMRFYRRADGTVITRDCPVGLRALRRKAGMAAARIAAAVVALVGGAVMLGVGRNNAARLRAVEPFATVCRLLTPGAPVPGPVLIAGDVGPRPPRPQAAPPRSN